MMRALACAALILAGATVAAIPAEAHGRGRVHFGVTIGGPLWWHRHWDPWPYHHYPYRERVIVERRGPTVYVEKDPAGVERDADQYWYHCPDSETYYPYVKTCASPWHRVVPHSPPPQ